jgi:phospholipase/carboxylesterase
MTETALGFVHRYIPPSAEAESGRNTTLLMLHGTGGDEDSLVSFGQTLLPVAAILSPRGQVDENGAARFFRRIREGVLDLEDLALRTDYLAEFIEAAARTYELALERIVAVGFSNGANIAASLLLRRPGFLRRAILLSPTLPFEPDVLPNLSGTGVFIGAGRTDQMVPADKTERLFALLRDAGADVQIHWEPGGHSIAPSEFVAARAWLRESEKR